MVDRDRIEAAVRELLAAVGDDPQRSELAETPRRVAESYEEFFAGVGLDPLPLLTEGSLPATSGQTVLVRDLTFRSMCEHHLLPFTGRAHIAYVPDERIVGFGRLPRMIDVLASRPQLQERLTEQIADTVATGLASRGVLVVLQAAHGCLRDRGPQQRESTTVTVAARGVLAEPDHRAETLNLLALSGAAASGAALSDAAEPGGALSDEAASGDERTDPAGGQR